MPLHTPSYFATIQRETLMEVSYLPDRGNGNSCCQALCLTSHMAACPETWWCCWQLLCWEDTRGSGRLSLGVCPCTCWGWKGCPVEGGYQTRTRLIPLDDADGILALAVKQVVRYLKSYWGIISRPTRFYTAIHREQNCSHLGEFW